MQYQIDQAQTSETTGNPVCQYHLVDWILNKHEAEIIQLAQRYGMRVVITFLNRLESDVETQSEMSNSSQVAPNGTLYLTVFNGTGEDETRIILKRTPKRLLRPGSQLIVTFREEMYWKLPSEPVRAQIIDFWENESKIKI